MLEGLSAFPLENEDLTLKCDMEQISRRIFIPKRPRDCGRSVEDNGNKLRLLVSIQNPFCRLPPVVTAGWALIDMDSLLRMESKPTCQEKVKTPS